MRGPFKRTKYVSSDWSVIRDAPGPGLQEVAVEVETTADGRDITWILDGSGNRFPDPAAETPNPAQRQIWENQTKDDKEGREAGDTKPTNVYIGRNPKTGKISEVSEWPDGKVTYDDTNVPSSSGTGPPGGKTFIDDGPDAGQAGRRWGWNPETKQYDRDLGPSPSAQKGPEKNRVPVPGKPGIYQVTTKNGTQTETHYEDEQGNVVPTPVETGSSKKPVQGNPGIYEVTTKNGTQTETHYEDEAGNRVPAPAEKPKPIQGPDGSYGYWDNSTPPKWVRIEGGPGAKKEVVNVNGQYGVWEPGPDGVPAWKPVQGPPARKTVEMEAPPNPDQISAWLWDEQKKLDALVNAQPPQLTPEEAIAEMKKRREFAASIAGEYEAKRQREEKAADRESANARQGMQSGTSIFTSVAPTMLTSGMKLLPGNGEVAAQGFLAALQLGQIFAERLAGGPIHKAGARVTAKPDGTIEVDTAAAPQPTRNAQGLWQSPAGGVYQPGEDPREHTVYPGGWFQPGAPPPNEQLAAALGAAGAMQSPVFRPSPPVQGSENVVPTDPNAIASILQGGGGGMPAWMAQKAAGQPAPEEEYDDSYLDGAVADDDGSWSRAVAEARRRNRLAVRGVAA